MIRKNADGEITGKWDTYLEYAEYQVLESANDFTWGCKPYPNDRRAALNLGYEWYIIPGTTYWRTRKVDRTQAEYDAEMESIRIESNERIEIQYDAVQIDTWCAHQTTDLKSPPGTPHEQRIYETTELPTQPCGIKGCKNDFCEKCKRDDGVCMFHYTFDYGHIHVIGKPPTACWEKAVNLDTLGYENIWIVPKFN